MICGEITFSASVKKKKSRCHVRYLNKQGPETLDGIMLRMMNG